MTKTAVGYLVVDGQFSKGKASNILFTGAVLIPEAVKPGMVYSKLNDDLFKKSTAINSIENVDDLAQNFQTLFDITFEKGTSPKYTRMLEKARQRFDRVQWWSLQEVIKLRDEAKDSNKQAPPQGPHSACSSSQGQQQAGPLQEPHSSCSSNQWEPTGPG